MTVCKTNRMYRYYCFFVFTSNERFIVDSNLVNRYCLAKLNILEKWMRGNVRMR